MIKTDTMYGKTVQTLFFSGGVIALGEARFAAPRVDARKIIVACFGNDAKTEAAFAALAAADQGRAQAAVLAMADDGFAASVEADLRDKRQASAAEAALNRFNPSFVRAVRFGANAEEVADGFGAGLRRCVGL